MQHVLDRGFGVVILRNKGDIFLNCTPSVYPDNVAHCKSPSLLSDLPIAFYFPLS